MTVGESLAEARCQAGLSVDELSERTRIRGTIIRSIERDDYEACGGDLYVRGYVRAIAGAVGIDAQPLIREYDLGRARGARGPGGWPTVPVPPMAPDPDITAFDLPPVTGYTEDPGGLADQAGFADPAETRFDLPPVTADPAATRFDLPPVRDADGEDLMAAGYEMAQARSGTPAGSSAAAWPRHAIPRSAPGARHREVRGGRSLIWVGAVLLLAGVGTAGFHLVSSGTRARNEASSSATRVAAPAASPGMATAGGKAAAVKPAGRPSATATQGASQPTAARPAHPRPHVIRLPVAKAEAFGPDGLADGDNPQVAKWAITAGAPLPWTTQWYATPDFGLLKRGTGLLLDLGRRVTISSVRVDLSQYTGVNLELRVGDGTAPRDLAAVVAAEDTGGVVRLTPRHPVRARYVLIWFTLLPPNGSGHYQESVYRVQVTGHR